MNCIEIRKLIRKPKHFEVVYFLLFEIYFQEVHRLQVLKELVRRLFVLVEPVEGCL